MLKMALDDPDPVIIFEHVMLYNREEPFDEQLAIENMHKAVVRKPGSDLSIFTWGGCLYKSMDAAAQLESKGYDIEVVDLRCLRPLDRETIIESIQKTHKAIIVDESWKSVGMSAEISATLAEQALYYLDAPIRRINAKEVPIPYAEHLEAASIPQTEEIVHTALAMLQGE